MCILRTQKLCLLLPEDTDYRVKSKKVLLAANTVQKILSSQEILKRKPQSACLGCSHFSHLVQFGPLPVGSISFDVISVSERQIWFRTQYLGTGVAVLTHMSIQDFIRSHHALILPLSSSLSPPPRHRHRLGPSHCARCPGYPWRPEQPSASQSGCSGSRTTGKSPVQQEEEQFAKQVNKSLKVELAFCLTKIKTNEWMLKKKKK